MNKIIFWGLIALSLGSFMYLISETLAPFVIAFVFAYLLQPIIEKSTKRFNISRNFVAFGIFITFIGIFIATLIILLPVIYNQVSLLISKIPSYRNTFQLGLTNLLTRLDTIDPEIAHKVSDSLQKFVNSAFSIVTSIANNIWGYTLATINFFGIIALVPIILYYFLRDWPKMVKTIESVLPMKEKSKVGKICADINRLLSAYIRGQLNICLLLGIYYVIGLNLIGLDLAMLIGISAGFLIIIPFIGNLISLCLMIAGCYFSYGYSSELVYVLILFTVGFIAEGYIITPKIIGGRIGLHPVWIMFSVFAAGSILGLVGVMFAIPIAGIVKILLSHMVDYYKSSRIYNN